MEQIEITKELADYCLKEANDIALKHNMNKKDMINMCMGFMIAYNYHHKED